MKKNKAFVFAALAVFVIVSTFWLARTVDYEFLQLDDVPYVTDNQVVQDGLSVNGIKWAFANMDAGSNWHPATWLSLMFDATISVKGSTSALSSVMHRHNAVLQGVSAALLFLVLLAIGGVSDKRKDVLLAILLSLFWGLHPLRAECVCWVTERKELLCTLFSLLTILLWIMRFRGHYVLALISFSFALLSKSVAVTVPVLIIGLDLVRSRGWRSIFHGNAPKYVVMFVLSLAASYFTVVSQKPAIEGNIGDCPLSIRVVNAFGAYAEHFVSTIAPVNLYFYHPMVNTVNWMMFVLGFILCGLMLYSLVRFLRNQSHAPGFLAALWIGAGLVPMCGIVRVGIEMNPDRFAHWIGCGFVLLLYLLLKRVKRLTNLTFIIFAGLVTVIAVTGWHYAGYWRNNFILFQRTVKLLPDHPQALSQLGAEYEKRFHERDKAIECFERSIELYSVDEVGAQLVTALMMRGRPEDWKRIKVVCSRVRKDHSCDDKGAALTALGVALMHEQNWQEASSCFADAIPKMVADKKLKGDRRPIEDNLMRIAMCYLNAKQYRDAKPILRELSQSKNQRVAAKAKQLLEYIFNKELSQR